GSATRRATSWPMIEPPKYTVFSTRSERNDTERPVSSTELRGLGSKVGACEERTMRRRLGTNHGPELAWILARPRYTDMQCQVFPPVPRDPGGSEAGSRKEQSHGVTLGALEVAPWNGPWLYGSAARWPCCGTVYHSQCERGGPIGPPLPAICGPGGSSCWAWGWHGPPGG